MTAKFDNKQLFPLLNFYLRCQLPSSNSSFFQLTQVEAALTVAADEASKAQLKELQENLRELIALTGNEEQKEQDDEWKLFQVSKTKTLFIKIS